MTQSVFDMMKNTVMADSLQASRQPSQLVNPVYSIHRNQAAMAASVAEGGEMEIQK